MANVKAAKEAPRDLNLLVPTAKDSSQCGLEAVRGEGGGGIMRNKYATNGDDDLFFLIKQPHSVDP